ncbi:tRNA (guanosine(46)-N7)-methyltransferase TrmB [Henriciella barbarensis]|uniref:tRNA (guanine-N(7)-)-methyltransferase n=1 Tax=Henriciella barbarensis TaxID=86342 RepID=A0A399R4E1_9PROT|nr:tRNA (guanosine(46)-N7)-methyltransferase TrmB [Henriciella barbarensis]
MRSFGRKGGRPLSGRQQSLVDNLLPRLRLPRDAAALDTPLHLFDAEVSKLWLEIGFGGGEHVSSQAKASPDAGIMASEVFIEGIAKCLSDIDEMELPNVRLWDEDARDLVDLLPDACLDRVFILFPDPWPKKRHQKRRIIQPDFLRELTRVMKPGARLRFATDVRSYADEALTIFLAEPRIEWLAAAADDWRKPPADHFRTRYETKNLGDIAPVFYDFERKCS